MYYEKDYAVFTRCGNPTEGDRYCAIGGSLENINDPSIKFKYPFSKFIGRRYIQSFEYPITDISSDYSIPPGVNPYFVQLNDAVTADMVFWINTFSLNLLIPSFGYNSDVINNEILNGSVSFKWWNVWSLYAYSDAYGDGIIDTQELVDFAFETNDRSDAVAAQIGFVAT